MNSLNPVRVQRKIDKAVTTPVQKRSCSKPILESHLDLLKEGTFSDVIFIVGPTKERIPCHQLFLKARSRVFEVMFSERWNEHGIPEVLLNDVDPQIFIKFLEFMYSDTFVANVSEALELLQVAHKYDVQLLVSKCEKLLESEVTLDDAVDVFLAARKYDKIQLMHKVGDLMAKSLSKLQTLPSFSRVDKHTLIFILKRDDLKMKEVDLFRLATQWAKSQSGLTVRQSLEDILPLIRFPIMTLTEFTTIVVPTGLLPQSTLIELFTYFGTEAETKKSLASSLMFSTQQRGSTESIVSYALYSENIEGAGIIRAPLRQLQESLVFGTSYDCLQSQLSLRGRNSMKQPIGMNGGGIGLNGVSFYCTARTKAYGMVSSPLKEFKILVESLDLAYFDEGFKELFRLFPVRAEEGKMTEVVFDDTIPLENDMNYRISVEEIKTAISAQGFGRCETYDGKNLGSLQRNATVKVGDTRLSLHDIQRNNICGFVGGAQLQLILKLSFKEL